MDFDTNASNAVDGAALRAPIGEGAKSTVSETLKDAQNSPWQHGFMPLMRRMAAAHPELPAIGQAQRPQQENFRLGQQASLAFAPRELAQVRAHAPELGGRAQIKLFGLGMLGPNGALPIHFTELVRERTEAKRDSTLNNFIDLFHHRAFTHFYRAWAQGQSAAGLDRAEDETFTPYIARLAGDEPEEVQNSALPPHARWASAAHRIRNARNPDGLVSTVADFFGVTAQLLEYRLQWMRIEEPDECHLGWPRLSSVVGQGAMLGEVVPDRQSQFRLVIGPLDMEGYLRFTPQGSPRGSDLPVLIDLVRSYIGFEYVWEVELLVRRDTAPATRLGDSTQLGWSTWMGNESSAHSERAITGMIFEPESYASHYRATHLAKVPPTYPSPASINSMGIHSA